MVSYRPNMVFCWSIIYSGTCHFFTCSWVILRVHLGLKWCPIFPMLRNGVLSSQCWGMVSYRPNQTWGQFNSGIGIDGQFQFQFRNCLFEKKLHWNWIFLNWNWIFLNWNWNWNLVQTNLNPEIIYTIEFGFFHDNHTHKLPVHKYYHSDFNLTISLVNLCSHNHSSYAN